MERESKTKGSPLSPRWCKIAAGRIFEKHEYPHPEYTAVRQPGAFPYSKRYAGRIRRQSSRHCLLRQYHWYLVWSISNPAPIISWQKSMVK